MRASEWQIIWAPTSSSRKTLLDVGDLMPNEVARNLEGEIDFGRFDFARSARPVSRGNVKRRLEFSRLLSHDTAAESWDACAEAIASAPWGEKEMLAIRSAHVSTPQLTTPAVAASGDLTIIDIPEPGDTVTVDSHLVTWIATGPAGPNEIVIDTGEFALVENTAALAAAFAADPKVSAEVVSGAVVLTARSPGVAGNEIALAVSGTAVATSADHLTGGADAVYSIEPSPARFFQAALLSTSHEPVSENGIAESLHGYAFRTRRINATYGDAITIIGGWFNPPEDPGGGGGGTVTIEVPGTPTIPPGGTIEVIDVPGVPPGWYNIPPGGITIIGGNTQITVPINHGLPGRLDLGLVMGSSRSGRVTAQYPDCNLIIRGIDNNASYEYLREGTWHSVGAVFGSAKSFGLGTLDFTRGYQAWWGANQFAAGPPIPELNPLELDGGSRPNGSGSVLCTQTLPSPYSVALRRNGVIIDTFSVNPDWVARKGYQGGGPANHWIDAGVSITLTLRGPGGGSLEPTGVSEMLPPGGTIRTVEFDS